MLELLTELFPFAKAQKEIGVS